MYEMIYRMNRINIKTRADPGDSQVKIKTKVNQRSDCNVALNF